MIAAPASGSGKTLLTCGLLSFLKRRGLTVQSFKCGPDFIDPMFHTHITGRPAGNLDAFMASEASVRRMLAEGMQEADFTVIEGVMGCFDGISFGNAEGSSCYLADMTDTPVILVVNARGMSTTILPLIRGMMEFPGGHVIKGVILNRITKGIYPAMKRMIESELPVRVAGYLPPLDDVHLDSRHLGLMMPHEIADLDQQLERLSDCLRDTLEPDVLYGIADLAGSLSPESSDLPGVTGQNVRIGVAEDEAFCFFYAENLRMLERRGARLVRFSPVHDREIPDHLDALLLCGGYPELLAEQLSDNCSMRESIRRAYREQLPILAECGGFLYLHETLEDPDGRKWPMCGIIPADAFHNHRLTRFGYITLQGGQFFGKDTGPVRAHEFHHYESADPGDSFCAVKPDGKRRWNCIHSTEHLYAGFPHLYFPANPAAADAFVAAAVRYHSRRGL